LVSLVLLAVGIGVSLRPRNVRIFLRCLGLGYVCAFVLGGLGMMLASQVQGGRGGLPQVSWWLLVASVVLAYLCIKLGLKAVQRLTLKKQLLCQATIFWEGREAQLQALVDTGHTLKDPLSRAPVLIAEHGSLMPLQLPSALHTEDDPTRLLGAAETGTLQARLRLVPFVSLGAPNGMLVGFRPDRVALATPQKQWLRDDIVVGVYPHRLCHEGRYQGLIGAEMLS